MAEFLSQSEVIFDSQFENSDWQERPLSLAIGMFDGVHLGHQAVIRSAKKKAAINAGVPGALTFTPHPSKILRPDKPTRLIISDEMKSSLLFQEGLKLIIKKAFTRDFAQNEASEFLPLLKKSLPNLKTIHVGSNFRFGRKRIGDIDLLQKSGEDIGIDVFSLDRIKVNGIPVSSSIVRDHLESGRLREANAILGWNYTASGNVAQGKQMGSQIGFPTINLPWNPELKPAYGVYFVRIKNLPDSASSINGVANFGIRPTVETTDVPVLEIHCLEPVLVKPGDPMEVEWLEFHRGEQKFENVDALKEQISKDKAAAAQFFEHRPV